MAYSKITHLMSHTLYRIILSITIILFALAHISCDHDKRKDILTPEERAWLTEHDGKIVIDRSIEEWAPIEALDEKGEPSGIAIDYYRLIEKKLGFKFKVDEPRTFQERLKKFKNREIDVVNNLQKNPKREEYLLFTKPYINIHNVIIVRKEVTKSLRLNEMKGISISITRDFAIYDYIKSKYSYLTISPADNDRTVLLDVSIRRSDAAVVNLAVASHIIEKDGITNLRIAGQSGYVNALSIASRKDWPILNRILEKGLTLITPEERKAIWERWIHLTWEPFYKNKIFQTVVAILTLILVISAFWIALLRKEIAMRKRAEIEKEVLIKDLQEALSKVKTLNGLLPICSNCKKIRDDTGYWNQIEEYIESQSDAFFSHSICPECAEKLYSNDKWYKKKFDKK